MTEPLLAGVVLFIVAFSGFWWWSSGADSDETEFQHYLDSIAVTTHKDAP